MLHFGISPAVRSAAVTRLTPSVPTKHEDECQKSNVPVNP